MRKIRTENVTTLGFTFNLPMAQYGLLAVEYNLDAAAGVTITRSQLGSIRLSWNGEDVINVDAEILNLLNNIYGGVAEFSAAAGGATRCMVFIPVGMWWDSLNVYDVGANDQVILTLSFPALVPAVVDSGSISIYMKEKAGVHNYFHKIAQKFVVAGGSGDINEALPINNITQLYYKNPSALLSNMQIIKDQTTIVDSTLPSLTAYSDWIHQLESTNTTLALEFAETKDIREAIGRQVSYKLTFSGAGTLSQYYSYVQYASEQKRAESLAKSRMKLQNTVASVRNSN